MPYPRRLLNDGEDVVLDLRPHWWFLTPRLALVLFTMVLALFSLTQDWPDAVLWLVLVVLVVALVRFGVRYAQWVTTNFVVTTDRLIYRHGVLGKSGIEIPLERVNNVIFHQSPFERILGAGDLLIESAGESGQSRFSDIVRPSLVQNQLYKLIEANQNRVADRMAGNRALSVPEQLEKLDELRRRGVISDDEFERKKADLLDRM